MGLANGVSFMRRNDTPTPLLSGDSTRFRVAGSLLPVFPRTEKESRLSSAAGGLLMGNLHGQQVQLALQIAKQQLRPAPLARWA